MVDIPGLETYSISVGDGKGGFLVQSMAWSPEGSELAFAVTYEGWFTEDPLPQSATDLAGLYLLDTVSRTTTRILSHGIREPSVSENIVAKRRTYIYPEWSPDGEAILVRDQRWELEQLAWLYPLDREGMGSTLHKPTVGLVSGQWSSDSRYLYMYGCAYCLESDMDLIRVNRLTGETETLIDGGADRFWAGVLLVTPSQLILTADTPEHERRLFSADPDDLLGTLTPIGPSAYGCSTAWTTISPDAKEVAILCRDSLRILSLSGSESADLTHLFHSVHGRLDIAMIRWGGTPPNQ